MAAATAAPSGTYLAGRFGGFGPLKARLGGGPRAVTLTAVSSDDDPAYDAFVARVEHDGVV